MDDDWLKGKDIIDSIYSIAAVYRGFTTVI